MNKRGVFGLDALPQVAMALLIVGLIFAVGMIVLSNFQADASVVANTDANQSIADTISASSNVTTRLPLVGTMIGLGIVLIVVFGLFLKNKNY